MANFENYKTYLSTVVSLSKEDFKESDFKSNPQYTQVLENVSKEKGIEYLKRIESDFPEITYTDIKEYINVNNKYGQSMKTILTMSNNKLLYCSPSCMRYIYHSLIILKKIKETGNTEIVEIGAGYGGLYLALNIFAPKLNVLIEKYYIIDLFVVTELLKKYLMQHMDILIIPLEIYDNNTDHKYINSRNLYLISNYCITSISETERMVYINTIIKNQVSHGFIIWQTCFGCDISNVENLLQKPNIHKIEEIPQTSLDSTIKNYYVNF